MPDLSPIPALAQAWMDAWIAKDRGALEDFLAPDYALVGAAFAGRAFERAAWLETAIDVYDGTAATFADPLVRLLAGGPPALAAMSAVWTQEARQGEHDLSGRYWITDVWRQGGPRGWRVVHRSSVALDTLAASSRAFAAR